VGPQLHAPDEGANFTLYISASEMTYIVSSGALNSTHYHYCELYSGSLSGIAERGD